MMHFICPTVQETKISWGISLQLFCYTKSPELKIWPYSKVMGNMAIIIVTKQDSFSCRIWHIVLSTASPICTRVLLPLDFIKTKRSTPSQPYTSGILCQQTLFRIHCFIL